MLLSTYIQLNLLKLLILEKFKNDLFNEAFFFNKKGVWVMDI